MYSDSDFQICVFVLGVLMLQTFEAIGGKITKTSGDDNNADLGFHKKK